MGVLTSVLTSDPSVWAFPQAFLLAARLLIVTILLLVCFLCGYFLSKGSSYLFLKVTLLSNP